MIRCKPYHRWSIAGLSFCVALLCSVVLAGATHPPGFFPKYAEALRAPEATQAERLLDYSPLYLLMTRLLMPVGTSAVLWGQCLLHALAAATIALTVGRLASRWWSLAAGLAAASYRPFLVYCGVAEPEVVILGVLSLGILLGLSARQRLEASARGAPLMGAVAGASVALSAAAILRPQYLLLIPAWGLWIAGARERESGPSLPLSARSGRRWMLRIKIWVLMGAISALVILPVVISRWSAAGVPLIMNPGPVFYEGNGPAATGLVRHAPELVRLLEDAHPEAFDYGHVAYRRLATASLGHETNVKETNRYWTSLAAEGIRAFPYEALRRMGKKALMAVMPYEGHDLLLSEDLDRRIRPFLPWGFGLLLIPIPCLALVRRRTLEVLAGPLTIAALSLIVQFVFYASARQRLPMALALLVAGPVLGSELWARRLRFAVRRRLTLLMGVAFSALAGFLTAPVAISDQLNWDRAMPGGSPVAAGWLSRLLDGRMLQRGREEDAERFAISVGLVRAGRVREAAESMRPLCGRGLDFTVSDGTIGVPEYWMGLAQLAVGNRTEAAESVRAASRTRPGELRIAALRMRLDRNHQLTGPFPGWRAPGSDAISRTWALAVAAALDGDQEEARRILAPIAAHFPELLERPIQLY